MKRRPGEGILGKGCTSEVGEGKHCFTLAGLDDVAGVFSHTRRCVWCGQRESRPYLTASERATASRRTLTWRVEPKEEGVAA
jgi:hypothetical protein